MSDTIRQLMRERQSGSKDWTLGLLNAGPGGIIGPPSPGEPAITGPPGMMVDPLDFSPEQYESIIRSEAGPSMAALILDQYRNGLDRNIQKSMSQGDPAQLMRPMISSVVQLDR